MGKEKNALLKEREKLKGELKTLDSELKTLGSVTIEGFKPTSKKPNFDTASRSPLQSPLLSPLHSPLQSPLQSSRGSINSEFPCVDPNWTCRLSSISHAKPHSANLLRARSLEKAAKASAAKKDKAQRRP